MAAFSRNWFGWLHPRRSKSGQAAEPTRITLYTRIGCCLCDDAKAMLERFAERYPLSIEEIDIDERPEFKHAYNDYVPVVAIEGIVRFRGMVNPMLLERELRQQASRRSSRRSE